MTPSFWQCEKAHPYYYLQSLWRVSGAVQFIGVVVDIRVVVDISGGHHSGQHRQRAIISCTRVITQCTFNFIIHCCHCNHCNDCAYCTLYTYILCITQPTSVNVSCDHIASLRLLEIQSKVLAFLRSWRWGAAGFADLPLNLRFQSFFLT